MRRLDIGVASYKNPACLRGTLASIQQNSTTAWRCFILMSGNTSEENCDANLVAREFAAVDNRFVLVDRNPTQDSYSGAVNVLFTLAETEYIAYLDNDVTINTHGWDETLCGYLDRFHEIGMVHPNGGAAPIDRGPYTEIMWAAGFAWVINRHCMVETGQFDDAIGHQNECDYAMRVRMAGWKCAAVPSVSVSHHATATNDPAAIERIGQGVMQFVNKWCRYFGGKNLTYHSPNVLRWDDWPPNALYLEEYWKLRYPTLNDAPEVWHSEGRDYDLIRVPRYKDFYRTRII